MRGGGGEWISKSLVISCSNVFFSLFRLLLGFESRHTYAYLCQLAFLFFIGLSTRGTDLEVKSGNNDKTEKIIHGVIRHFFCSGSV